MRIAFVDPSGSPYDGSTPSKRALGGSESAVVFMARELVKLGMHVHVFCDCESLDAKSGVYDGVKYFPLNTITYRSEHYDVQIACRTPESFMYHTPLSASKNVLWMHDTFCKEDAFLEGLLVAGTIDEIWTLSDFHTSYITNCNHGHRRMMEVMKRKIWQTRNGCNFLETLGVKDRNVFVFNASVSKGMEVLLDKIWPRIFEALGYKVRLEIIGGAYHLKEKDEQHKKLQELFDKHNGNNNVSFLGLMTQEQVHGVVSQAGFTLYPQTFPETYGISNLESLAHGTPVITGRFGASEEVCIEDGSYLMDYPISGQPVYNFNEDVHIEAFIQHALSAYNNEYLWKQKCNGALKVREVCTWDKVAIQWKQHIFQMIGEYLPVNEYRKVTRINHRVREIFNRRWSDPKELVYYPEKEKMIHVIVPFYNASQYLNDCIESIKAQDYENYEVYLIDDASTDGWSILEYDGGNYRIYVNKERVGALANQVKTIQDRLRFPENDDTDEHIIILIDGDDKLANDPNIFKRINKLYHEGAEFTYGSCRSMADGIDLIAQEYPRDVIEKGTFRDHKFAWNVPYTHLRTFSYDLFTRIDLSTLTDSNGSYYKAGGDAALFYSLIEKCVPDGIVPVRDVLYLYNDLNPINDYKVNSEEQQATVKAIMNKKKILIAIPTANYIHPETFKSIYNLEIPDGYEADFQYFFGYRVDQVRNLIADWVIKGYDYLFSVDHDIGFDPNTLKKLLECDSDIASGLYVQRNETGNLEIYRDDKIGKANLTMEDIKGNDDVFYITGCGMGCALIKKKVFLDIGYPQYVYHPALRFEDNLSEDIDFCKKATDKGFKIRAHGKVICRHYGERVFLPKL